MRHTILPFALITLLLLVLLPATPPGLAQGDPDNGPPATDVTAVLAADERFSTLNAALDAAGFLPLLQNAGPYTLLAPTDDAFDDLLQTLDTDADSLFSNTALLQRVLLLHVLPGWLDAQNIADLDEQNVATSLSGATLPVAADDNTVTIGTATITASDILAENGVVHVLDSVLVPENDMGSTDTFFAVALGPETTLSSTLTAADDGNELPLTLSALVEAAGYTELLNGPGSFTLFAPTNAALQRTLERLGDDATALLNDTEQARAILAYHLVPAAYTVADLQGMERSFLGTALQRRLLTMAVEDEAVLINDAPLAETDIITGNGIIHYVDAVLFPAGDAPAVDSGDGATLPAGEAIEDTTTIGAGDATQNLAEIVGADEQFSTLFSAVAAAGLADVLARTGPYTVFAPTNAAFDAFFAAEGLDPDVVLADVELLAQILLYHIAPGRLNTEALATIDGNELATALPGSSVVVRGETIGGVNITTANIAATNGVVHSIDAVLVPTEPSLSTILLAATDNTVIDALSADEFSLFLDALNASGLATTLENGGPYTLFVPTNDALSAFLVRSGLSRAELLNNVTLAQQVLLYHIVPYRYLAEDLPLGDAASYGTLITGQTLFISRDADAPELILVNEAQVSGDAITTANGVVFPIDDVLVVGD